MSDATVTKRDLDQAIDTLRGELRADMAALRVDMNAMKTDLVREIGAAASHVANVMMEQIRTLVSVVEEKYQDLPPQHAKLRTDFDTHAADRRLHTRPPTTPAKRTRRSRSR